MPEEIKKETPPADEQKIDTTQFVNKTDFQSFENSMRDLVGTVRDSVTAIANATAPKPIAEVEIVEPTNEEIAKDIQDGKADKVIAAMDGKTTKSQRQVLARLNQMEEVGMSAIGGLVKKAALGALNDTEKKYIKKYQKEVDSLVEKVDPRLRLHEETHVSLMRVVLGGHMDEIIKAEREEALRGEGGDEAEQGGKPDARGGSRGKQPAGPSDEEIFGKDAIQSLNALGKGGKTNEEFAKSLGYKSWEDYRKLALESEGEA